jgi:hypothetical protein
MMQVSKRIPFDDPNTLNMVRGLYICSNLIILAIYSWVAKSIKDKKGMAYSFFLWRRRSLKELRREDIAKFLVLLNKDQTTLKYVEPAPPMSGESGKLVTTTISEYDNSQLKSAFKSVLMGVGMMAVMHLYFKYTNPLLIQSMSCRDGLFHFTLY